MGCKLKESWMASSEIRSPFFFSSEGLQESIKKLHITLWLKFKKGQERLFNFKFHSQSPAKAFHLHN